MSRGYEPEEEPVEETWHDGLEGQPLDIVGSDSPVQCVQAGPGTGKSFCMTRRMLRLLQQRKVEPHEVLAVTFTRTAANDLRKELSNTLGSDYQAFKACTLHSLCFDIVKGHDFLATRNRVPRFILAVTKAGCLNFEAAPMLADLKYRSKAFGGRRDQSKRIKAFEAMWAKQQEDPLAGAGSEEDIAYGAELLSWLTFHGAMLVGELVKEAYEFLNGEPDSAWRTKFKAVLVDEYQDLNKLDQSVIDLLTQSEGVRCSVVGDFDQSIYSFRCAHPAGLANYSQREGVESMTMDTSRRCPKLHLRAAQTLIKQNTRHANEYPTPMANAIDGYTFVRRLPSPEQEIEAVVNFVKYCMDQGIELGRILVMSPSRVIGRDIRRKLNQEGVEAISYFAEEQLEELEAQKAFTILSLLANPKDRVSLRCWLGGWTDSQNQAAYGKLRKHCEDNGLEPRDALDSLLENQTLVPGTGPLVARYRQLLDSIEGLSELKGQELLDWLFPADQEWAEDMRALVGEVIAEGTSASDLHDLLVEAITQPSMPSEVSHVRVMSLHKAKGLSAQASAIVGACEGLVPRAYDETKAFVSQEEHFEEQRRLFYVALTRSKEYLLVSSTRYVPLPFAFSYQLRGRAVGGSFETITSRFVTSLGDLLPGGTNSTQFP